MLSNNIYVWICLLGLGFVIVLLSLPLPPQPKEDRLNEEERRRSAEAKKASEARQVEEFLRHRLVVYIRQKDGKRSSFEATLVKMLLRYSITVETISKKDGEAITEGDVASLKDRLALVGTTWQKNNRWADHEAGIMREFEYTCCDYRLIAAGENGTGEIIGAGYEEGSTSHQDMLAGAIFKGLCLSFPVMSEK